MAPRPPGGLRVGSVDGLEATTHHGSIESLRGGSKVRVHDDARFVDNGRISTSAGVSAGIDASLHPVGRLLTSQTAKSTTRSMEYSVFARLLGPHWKP